MLRYFIAGAIDTIQHPRKLVTETPRRLRRLAYLALERSWHLREPLDETACAVFSPEQLRKWTGEPDAVLATQYFVRAMRLVKRDRIDEAARAFSPCLRLGDNPTHCFGAAQTYYHGLGRMRRALELWTRVNDMRHARAARLGVSSDRYRVLNNFWVVSLGHTAQIDFVIRQGILEGRDPRDTILYAPAGSEIPNRYLMEQWRPYLQLVQRSEDLPFAEEAVDDLRLLLHAPRRDDGSTAYFWGIAGKVYRRWREEGRAPLLTLRPSLEERGRAVLARAGVPRDSWFVSLHIREGGYHGHRKGMHAVRNCSIQDYLPAIGEITRRGGWVVRLGDPSMSRLPPMRNVLDYCHSEFHADWMDIFLAAKCRFAIGTSSGVVYVCHAYGVPVVLTNWFPPAQRPWMAHDIFLPKLHRRKTGGRYLTLAETLGEPFGYCEHAGWMEKNEGVTVEDNTAEDITAGVVEMCDRLDGKATYDDEDQALRARAHDIYERCNAIGSAVLARDFLKSRKWLVD